MSYKSIFFRDLVYQSQYLVALEDSYIKISRERKINLK